MNILYITASCLTKNTSANMSHNSYLQGLIECEANVDVIMAKDSWGEKDNKLPKFDDVNYYEYNSTSLVDKLLSIARKIFPTRDTSKIEYSINLTNQKNIQNSRSKSNKKTLRDLIKSFFYSIFKPDPIYPLSAVWLKNAAKFRSKKNYDLVISNSSPAASHKLMSLMKKKGNIQYKKWIQIWEDPWAYDLYGGKTDNIEKEEYSLLQDAEKVYYVSPLTLYYQKIYFADWASKMDCIPLPYLKFGNGDFCPNEDVSFGYFGDYYSYTRNLIPFYNALCLLNAKGFIYGDSDLHLKETNRITVSGRVTLDVLEKVQDTTSVLVHLCNLKGGQIPGKIYHYSATKKPILFILDGTEEEKKVLKEYFAKYNRYIFCDNDTESILSTMKYIIENYKNSKSFVVEQFSPKHIVSNLISKNLE